MIVNLAERPGASDPAALSGAGPQPQTGIGSGISIRDAVKRYGSFAAADHISLDIRPGEFVTLGDFIVWDIGMRMLTPRELARAQGFPESYDITAGGRLTETAQRHKIGNSVCPPLAEAVARANCIEALALPDVRRRKAKVAPWAGLPPRPAQDAFAGVFA